MTDKDGQVFFDDGKAKVTKGLVQIGSQTFATANITSVSVVVNHPSVLGPAVVILCGAFSIVAAVSYGMAGVRGNTDSAVKAIGLLLFGVFLCAVGVQWMRTEKPTYSLMLRTSSGEVRALLDREEKKVKALSSAILKAIESR